ncbi:MAG: hypothetical protein LBH44_01000, partial [Treponema sp.]|nr:hypothetical protein [Treponema sp.]
LNGFAVQRLTFSQGLPALSQAMEFPNMKLRPPNIRSASIVPISRHNAAFSSSPLPYAGYLSIAGYLPNITASLRSAVPSGTKPKRAFLAPTKILPAHLATQFHVQVFRNYYFSSRLVKRFLKNIFSFFCLFLRSDLRPFNLTFANSL